MAEESYSNEEINLIVQTAVATIATIFNGIFVRLDGSTPMTGCLTTPCVNTQKVLSDAGLRIIATDALVLGGTDVAVQASNEFTTPSKIKLTKNGNVETTTIDASAATGNRIITIPDNDGELALV